MKMNILDAKLERQEHSLTGLERSEVEWEQNQGMLLENAI